MPEINYGGNPQEGKVFDSVGANTPQDNSFTQTSNATVQEIPVDDSGLSSEELNDANKIVATITNKETPLVILFGPPGCGKTMTLVRLTRYLRSVGYTVQPDSSFRPSYDKNYSDMCRDFDLMINANDAARSTAKINFMLVHVIHQGRTLCQILEGPGEYYFNPKDPNAQFPRYMNAIINSSNRKIWAIIVEPATPTTSMPEPKDRANYVSKIHHLKKRLLSRDKVMFVFNKIDETQFVISPGTIKVNLAMQHIDYLYPGIFAPFKNVNPLTRWFNPNNFDFVAFQTGDFSTASDGTKTFEEGHDVYPKKLWELIRQRIRG